MRIFFIFFFIFFFLFSGVPAHAVNYCIFEGSGGIGQYQELDDAVTDVAILEAECEAICKGQAGGICTHSRVNGALPTQLNNPIRLSGGGQIDIPVFIGEAISRVLVVVGALTLLVFVFGGFLWLTSAGNEDRVKKGTQIMLFAAIGIFIIFASYGILNRIIRGLTGAS